MPHPGQADTCPLTSVWVCVCCVGVCASCAAVCVQAAHHTESLAQEARTRGRDPASHGRGILRCAGLRCCGNIPPHCNRDARSAPSPRTDLAEFRPSTAEDTSFPTLLSRRYIYREMRSAEDTSFGVGAGVNRCFAPQYVFVIQLELRVKYMSFTFSSGCTIDHVTRTTGTTTPE